MKRVTVAEVVSVVEKKRGETWAEFSNRHGDWGRELVLYLARQRSGLTLSAIGTALGMKEYKTVAKAIQRFASALSRDATKRRLVRECLNEMSKDGMLARRRTERSAHAHAKRRSATSLCF